MDTNTNECFIRVEDVSKKFCRSLLRGIYYGFIDIMFVVFNYTPSRSKLKIGEFWAVKKINLNLVKGDSVGVVGPNGSGKSTLLRMLSGIYEPDEGDIRISGNIVSFLAPGTGFHPHMTVRENIYINGAILGMSKKNIDEKIDEILEFAELKDCQDSPLGVLSPGMNMRLSISIAFASKPDIYIIDEVLAVGDIKFREKVINYLKLISSEVIIVLVSHNPEIISNICVKKLVLSETY